MGNWDLIIAVIFAGTGELSVTLWNKPYDEEANAPHPEASIWTWER